MLTVLRRVFSFRDWYQSHPNEPPPGDMLDASFDAQDSKISEIAALVESVRRPDGALQNGIVTRDSLDPDTYGDLRHEMRLAAHFELKRAQEQVNLAREAAESAFSAQKRAETSEIMARGDAATVATAKSDQLRQINALIAESKAISAELRAAEAALADTEDYVGYSEAWAESSRLWAEHMPDTLPDNALKMMDITGDHWSSRWWAHKAAGAFGALSELYLGAHPIPPSTTATGDPIPLGGIYYNTETGQIYVWDGSQWVSMTQPQRAGLLSLWYAAAEGQTAFPLTAADLHGSSFSLDPTLPEQLDAHVNGVKLMPKDSATDGDWTLDVATSTVTFLRPLRDGDLVAVDIMLPVEKLGPGAVQTWAMKLLEAKDGTRTTFTLATKDAAGPSVIVNKNEELLVSLDGVIQEPTVSYSAAGSSITFATAPAADVKDFINWFRAEPPDAVSGVEWNDILGKPATFPPTTPIAQSGVTNLTTDLANRVLKAGDTMTGLLTIAPSSGGAILYLDRPVGGNRYIETRVSGVPRWRIMLGNQNVESGSNTGTDFSLDRFSDAGAPLASSAITINRSDGIVQMPNGLVTGASAPYQINYTAFTGAPISTLVGGSTSGGLIEAPGSGHLVVGIRNNDIADSFSVVSYGVANAAPYDTLAFRVRADGTVFAGGQISSTAGVSAYSFGSPNTNGIFYATGAGTIFLRPNGAAVNTGQFTVDASGNATVNNGVLTATPGVIASGAGNSIVFRPGGASAEQMYITTAGDMTVNGAVTVVGDISAANLTDWVPYTPTFTGFGTVTGVAFESRRVGDTLYIRGVFTAGTTTAVQARITMGYAGTNGGVTGHTPKIPAAGALAGVVITTLPSVTSIYALCLPSVNYMTFGQQNSSTGAYASLNASALASVGNAWSIKAEIPITGW